MLKKKRRKVVDVNPKCDVAKEIYYQTALMHEIKRELEFLGKLLKTPKTTIIWIFLICQKLLQILKIRCRSIDDYDFYKHYSAFLDGILEIS